LSAKPIKNWALIFPASFEGDAKKFFATLQDQAPRLGIDVTRPNAVPLQSDRTEAYLKALKELPESTELAITLFGSAQRSDRYAAVKKFCYIERPMASQVILQKTISNERRLAAVVQKVALQINCKLGGELWSTRLPFEHLMIVGVDIYKDKAGGRAGKMIAAVVGSLNTEHTKFYSQCVFEEQGQNFKQGVADAVLECARKYAELHSGVAPRHVVVFRDGVNSGQLEMAHHEAENLGERFEKDPAFSHVTVTVAIVQKRHNTRLFSFTPSGLFDNPMAGSILDHRVTRRAWYDFYIVPMNVSMGTVTPTHFTVVFDNSRFSEDQLQRIAYAMTFMYFNWPGNVKVPAQCQYAHKLVELVGEHLHRAPHQSLNTKLYYL
jgi:aubergine-like protein